MIEAVKCQIENEMQALCIANVSNCMRYMPGLAANALSVGIGFMVVVMRI